MNTDTSKETEEAHMGEGGTSENLPPNGAAAKKEETPLDPVIDLQSKLQEAEKKYLYLYSDFENFRRRNERERLDFLKFGHEGFLREILQVVDNFERALLHAKGLNAEKDSPVKQVSQGIEMIHFQLMEALKSQGVAPVSSNGKKFDPALHEAVADEESDGDAGLVLREELRGYTLHGRLLRPARVIVAKKKID